MQQLTSRLEESAKALKATSSPDEIRSLEIILPEVLDFRSMVTRLKADNIKSIGLFLTPPQIKAFVVQARTQDFFPTYFGIDTFNDSEIRKLFSSDPAGPLFVDYFSDAAFLRAYEARFGDSSHVVEAARGQLLAKLLLYVSETATRPVSRDGIERAIDSFPSGTAAVGRFRIQSNPSFGRYMATQQSLYQIRLGQSEVVDRDD